MQYLVWKPDGCGNGFSWNKTLDLCYKVHTDPPKSWTDAENACIQDGGHLLKVDNLETNLLVNHFVVKHDTPIWIGGSDARNEGTWSWADNSSFETFWWDTEANQPDEAGLKRCLLIYNGARHPVNKWHDNACDWAISYVCQVPVEPTRC